jgi:electron transport complex protein RnfD
MLLLGAGYLIARRIIRWQIPTAYIAVFTILSWIFGGLSTGQGWLRGGVFYHLFAGSLVLAGFYMATDPVTSPLNPTGKILYGAGLGLLTFLLRFYGSAADGVPLAIILGNCFVPLIDILTRPRRLAPQKAPGI